MRVGATRCDQRYRWAQKAEPAAEPEDPADGRDVPPLVHAGHDLAPAVDADECGDRNEADHERCSHPAVAQLLRRLTSEHGVSVLNGPGSVVRFHGASSGEEGDQGNNVTQARHSLSQ